MSIPFKNIDLNLHIIDLYCIFISTKRNRKDTLTHIDYDTGKGWTVFLRKAQKQLRSMGI